MIITTFLKQTFIELDWTVRSKTDMFSWNNLWSYCPQQLNLKVEETFSFGNLKT